MDRLNGLENTPEIIELCTHCRHADCVGTCPEYRAKLRTLLAPRMLSPLARGDGVRRPVGSYGAKYELRGEAHTLAAWAERYGISYYTLYKRVCIMGWPLETALTSKVYRNGKCPRILIRIDGQDLNIEQCAQRFGINKITLYDRLCRGWSPREAIYGKEKHR